MMHIQFELDSQHAERMSCLQATWQKPLHEVVARLIDMGCTMEPENAARLTAFASEAVLRRDWDTPEEDAAWAHL
ncbi:MAG: hypothetical protein HQL87_05120 [Magnetococcales bacterium]|nr:hypothetical protein [Magnetococcales bacterium]